MKIFLLGASMLSTTLMCAPTFAAGEPTAAATYRRDRAACNDGASQQDKSACLSEAAAAYAQAKRGDLNDRHASYEQNAQSRCDALKDDDRRDCLARIQGQGTATGSAASGGIYRELVTPTPRVPTPQ